MHAYAFSPHHPLLKMETSPEVLESSSKKYAMHISNSNFEYLMPYQPGVMLNKPILNRSYLQAEYNIPIMKNTHAYRLDMLGP